MCCIWACILASDTVVLVWPAIQPCLSTSTKLRCPTAGSHQHQPGLAGARQCDQQPGRCPPEVWGAHPLSGLQTHKAAAGMTVVHVLQPAEGLSAYLLVLVKLSAGQPANSCVRAYMSSWPSSGSSHQQVFQAPACENAACLALSVTSGLLAGCKITDEAR